MNRFPCTVWLVFLFLATACQPSEKHASKKTAAVTARTHKANAFQEKADAYYGQAKYDSAFYYYTQAKAQFDLVPQHENSAYCLLQMARAQQTMGDYFGSEANLIEALPYIKNNTAYQPAAAILLGIAAKELKNYKDALRYYHQAYTLGTDSLTKAVALNNIANVHAEEGDYKKSVTLLEKVLTWQLLDTLPKRKALYMNNLGYAYTQLKQATKGRQLMEQALAKHK